MILLHQSQYSIWHHEFVDLNLLWKITPAETIHVLQSLQCRRFGLKCISYVAIAYCFIPELKINSTEDDVELNQRQMKKKYNDTLT